MVVDTSALVAILLGEPDAAEMAQAIEGADAPMISVASFVELMLVMRKRKGAEGEELAQKLVSAAGITIEKVDEHQLPFAEKAIRNYAVLNYGDLFSYALAQQRRLPLLFKGDDFSRTDVRPARP